MIMGDHYGDESQSASDQDELIGGSDMDADLSDTEEMQFTFCKGGGLMDTIGNDQESCSNYSTTQHEPKSKLIFFGMVVMLFLSAFVLLICFPLYFQQLNVGSNNNEDGDGSTGGGGGGGGGGDGVAKIGTTKVDINGNNVMPTEKPHNSNLSTSNAYGAILYVSTLITSFLLLATVIASWSLKWNLMVHKFPMPWKRLLTVSTCSGVAGTICIICSYQRVPCHLQDPLKGAALVYSLVFYFFFCRKTMGLQKIFSATTAVVGLFISVDYGMCDEFRCRGVDVTVTQTTGWQGRAVWTLIYVAGIALWTLHLSLLEGDIVTFYSNSNAVPQYTTLSTVSRIVSNAEVCPSESPKQIKYKPKALHIALWIHLFSLLISVFVGWIDIIPGSGSIQPIGEFWQTTGRTILCHLNINYQVPEETTSQQQATLEFLSNLTPGSHLYNKTVQKLRRSKRQIDKIDKHLRYFHKRINQQHLLENFELTDELDATVSNKTVHLHLNNTSSATITTPNPQATMFHHHKNVSSTNNNNNHTTASTNGTSSDAIHRKINTEKYRKKYKNYIKSKHKNVQTSLTSTNSNNSGRSSSSSSSASDIHHIQTPVKVSKLILNTIDENNMENKCTHLQLYSLLFVFVYVLFAMCLFQFLFMSESAVFTVAVISATLPIGGVFWSMFKLTTKDDIALIIWSPEITGELICSLLGTPIVILGLILLCTAHFNDPTSSMNSGTLSAASNSRKLYTSLSSRDS